MSLLKTPGWDDLLPLKALAYKPQMTDDQLRRVENASSNISDVITNGITAIGELTWIAADNTKVPIESVTIRRLGLLHMALSELIDDLRIIESNANFHRHELEMEALRATQEKAPATAATVQGH